MNLLILIPGSMNSQPMNIAEMDMNTYL